MSSDFLQKIKKNFSTKEKIFRQNNAKIFFSIFLQYNHGIFAANLQSDKEICSKGGKHMQLSTCMVNDALYIKISGEIDEHSCSFARMQADRLAETNTRVGRVVFDLNDVSFMDSTGIGFLIGRYKKFLRFGVRSYIINPSQTTDKILSMSGIYTLMPKL